MYYLCRGIVENRDRPRHVHGRPHQSRCPDLVRRARCRGRGFRPFDELPQCDSSTGGLPRAAGTGDPRALLLDATSRPHRPFPAGVLRHCAAGATRHARGGPGRRIMALPWTLINSWPLLDDLQPVRFSLFLSFVTAVVAALWMAGANRWAPGCATGIAVLAIAADPIAGAWASSTNVPQFFTESAYRTCLDPGETILPLPIGQGSAMLWQAEDDFRFNMTGGYVGPSFRRRSRNLQAWTTSRSGRTSGPSRSGSCVPSSPRST